MIKKTINLNLRTSLQNDDYIDLDCNIDSKKEELLITLNLAGSSFTLEELDIIVKSIISFKKQLLLELK